jgi:hypothetical protein
VEEAEVACFLRYCIIICLEGRSEEILENSQLGKLVSEPRFEIGISPKYEAGALPL